MSIVSGAAQYVVSLLHRDGSSDPLFCKRRRFIDCGSFAQIAMHHLARVYPELAGNFDGAWLHVFVALSDQRWTLLTSDSILLVKYPTTIVAIKFTDRTTRSRVTHRFLVKVSL